jgi:hypothetical protein
MKCFYNDFDCTEVDTSGMDKIDCWSCRHYSKISVCIASIPEREEMLKKTVESLRNQVNDLYIALNNYDHTPEFLHDCHVVLLDNKMGDAGKFFFTEIIKGYILTCDDDLIYPPEYVDYMIQGILQHPGCAVTLHGRDYSRPVVGFQQAFTGYPCLGDVLADVEIDVGGDGVMCWHTDYLKVQYEDFKQKNMSQIYFSKLCHEQNVPIIVLAHRADYLKYQFPVYTIWDEEAKSGFKRQTELLKSFLK